MMKQSDLDSVFDPTPDIFSRRIDTFLHALKEDEPVKKFTLRTGITALAFTLLFCSIAFAVVLRQGQEWYYNNRLTAYQEHNPDLQQAIMTNLQTEVPQEPSHDAQNLVDVTVQDYAWVAEKKLLTISVCAQLKDSGKYELHPMNDMEDNEYISNELDPTNPEGRTEHWLYTAKGFGPPSQVMDDPAKALLLADIGGKYITIGDSGIPLFTSVYDSFIGENGSVITVMEIALSRLPELVSARPSATSSSLPDGYTPLKEGDSGDSVRALQQALADKEYYHGDIHGTYDERVTQAVKDFQKANDLVNDGVAGPVTQTFLYQADAAQDDTLQSPIGHADSVNATIAQFTDKDGMLTLRLPYQVIPFENGGFLAPADGILTFKVKIR